MLTGKFLAVITVPLLTWHPPENPEAFCAGVRFALIATRGGKVYWSKEDFSKERIAIEDEKGRVLLDCPPDGRRNPD
jgi:hypothetical protein